MDEFVERLRALPRGYSTGLIGDRRYGATIDLSPDGKRMKLFAEELGGNDHVSFNLYFTAGGKPVLKPCEMPQEKVIDFVLNYAPDS